MNRSISKTTYATQAVGIVALALVFLTATFVLEGIFGAAATPRAHAWHCSITANTTTITEGTSATLAWDAANDTAYVTLDAFPGQQFERSGSVTVTPDTTTTYTAYTHVDWTDETMECSVTVEVEAPVCEATLSIDGSTFTWSGCPYMERYQATLCDGTELGPIYGEWNDDVTIDLGSRIAEVQACGENCHRTATQSCPTPEEPVAPSCPFVADADTVVVEFDGSKLRSDMGESAALSGPYNVALTEGTYTVETFSWDGYLGRENMSQPDESWYIEYLNSGSTVSIPGMRTSDLTDNALSAESSDTFTDIVLAGATDSINVRHAAHSDTSSPNSVVPICAAFTKVEEEEPETLSCNMSINPGTVRRNNDATLTWSSTNAVSATIDQGIDDVSVDGSTTVTPSAKTTYTGTFTDADGETVLCSATVSIKTGGGTPLKPRDNDDDDEEEEEEEEDEEPTFVLGKTVNSITLNQVPYTGFEAGPLMTALFWIGLFAVSALIAHVLTNKDIPGRLRGLFVAPNTPSTRPHATVLASPTRKQPTTATPVLTRADMSSTQQASAPAPATTIEEQAHAHSILLSPEAVRHIERAQREVTDVNAFLNALFASTIDTYPREDGWILLSDERAQLMIERTPKAAAKQQAMTRTAAPEAPAARVPSEPHRVESPRMRDIARTVGDEPKTDTAQVPQEQARNRQARPTQHSEAGTSVAPLFIDLIVAGEQQKTFELLRRLNTQGAATETFIAGVIRKLDDIYKNRLEGNHSPDKELAAKTATWSNADFETVLGILVESVDYSYSNPRIGSKIALAKLFEHFAK